MNNEIEFLEKDEKFFNTKEFWLAVIVGIFSGGVMFTLLAPTILVWFINYIAK